MFCKFQWHVWQETCTELTETQNSQVKHKFGVSIDGVCKSCDKVSNFPWQPCWAWSMSLACLTKKLPIDNLTWNVAAGRLMKLYIVIWFFFHHTDRKKSAQSRFSMLCNVNNCLTGLVFCDWWFSLKIETHSLELLFCFLL